MRCCCSLGMMEIMALGGGEEGEVVATVVDAGDNDDHNVPQQTNTHV